MAHFPFQRLQNDLSSLISRSAAGTKLPSEPDLAKQLKVSRATLREAMRMFEVQGLIRRRQGSGTFVVGKLPALDAGLEMLESIGTLAARQGLNVTVSDVAVESIPADAVCAEAFNIALRTPVISIRRAVLEEGRPVAYLIDNLRPGTLTLDQASAGFHSSVLDMLMAYQLKPTTSKARITAAPATAQVARALQIQRGAVLMEFAATLYDADGKVLDQSSSYFIPGFFRFHIVRRVGVAQ